MTETFRPSDDVIAREVGGEQVLLDMESGLYFGLGSVGTAVWQALEAEPSDLERLTDVVIESFEVERDVARADIGALLGQLEAKGLIARA